MLCNRHLAFRTIHLFQGRSLRSKERGHCTTKKILVVPTADDKAVKANLWLRTGYLLATFAALATILLFLFGALWPHGPGISPVGPYIPKNP